MPNPLSSPPHLVVLSGSDPVRRRHGDQPCQIIAVTSGKGGVGKTSVAGNLAVALSQRGLQVLLIDGDLGVGDLNLLFGLVPRLTLHDVLAGECAASEVVIAGPGGVSVLPACAASFRMANLNDDERQQVFTAIGQIVNDYDVIVVDTGAGLGQTSIHFAAAADQAVLVVTPEPTSIADAYAVAKVLSARHQVRRLWVLPNQVAGVREADQVFRCLATLVGRFLDLSLLLAGHVPADRSVPHAVRAGRPFQLHAPPGPAAQGLSRVAQRLVNAHALPSGSSAQMLFRRPLAMEAVR